MIWRAFPTKLKDKTKNRNKFTDGVEEKNEKMSELQKVRVDWYIRWSESMFGKL